MASLIVGGGESLRGSLWIQGSKNAALPMIAAAVLNRGITKIYHCPAISDVDNMLEIMKSLGCCIERTGEYVLIDSSQMDVRDISPEYAASMRSSVFLMGALLEDSERSAFLIPEAVSSGKGRSICIWQHLNG